MSDTDTHSMKLILSPQEIQTRVAQLAAQISQEFQGQDLVLVGVLKGAFIFMGDLARHLDLPVEMDFVRLASYGSSSQSCGRITMTKDCEIDLQGRNVLVVEDIVDTGLTLKWLVDQLRRRGAAQVKLCSLIDKSERREVALELDYVGFEIPRGFLVGYGLDFDERYRYLPGIYELSLES